MPSANDSSTMSALSVSTSAIGSPWWMGSPGCLSQRIILPSSMVSESLGITISLLMAGSFRLRGAGCCGALDNFLGGFNYVAGARQDCVLELGVVGHRRVERSDASHRGVEMIEGGFVDLRRDLGAGAAGAPSFVGDDHFPGLPGGGDDGFQIERIQGSQVDNLGVDAALLKCFGRR